MEGKIYSGASLEEISKLPSFDLSKLVAQLIGYY